MPGGSQNPNFVRAVKTTKVFIGSIAGGVTDAILTGLIHVGSVAAEVADKHCRKLWLIKCSVFDRLVVHCTVSTG